VTNMTTCMETTEHVVASPGIWTVLTPFSPTHAFITLLLVCSTVLLLAGIISGVLTARKRQPTGWIAVMQLMISINLAGMLVTALYDIAYVLRSLGPMEPGRARSSLMAISTYESLLSVIWWVVLTGLNVAAIQVISTVRAIKERKDNGRCHPAQNGGLT
jgi:hypothetical protein